MHPQPPRSLLVAYRLTAMRLPEQYRAWAAQDATTTTFLTWRIARSITICLAVFGLVAVGYNSKNTWPDKKFLVAGLALSIVFGLLSSRKTLIRKTLRWQHVNKHGAPVRPASAFVVLGNQEAALLAVIGLMLAASASAVLGYGLRPTGIKTAKCESPDAATTSQISGAFKAKGTTIALARMVEYENGIAVASIVKQPDKPDAQFVAFVSEGSTLSEVELVSKERPAPPLVTTLPKRTVDVTLQADLTIRQAVVRSATCLGEAGPR